MDPEIQKRFQKFTSNKPLVISLVVFLLLIFAVAGQTSYSILKNDKIYNGVHINGIDVSGLSTEELSAFLKKNFEDKLASAELEIKCQSASEKIRFTDLKVEYDIDASVNDIYSVGRTGNAFQRLHEVFQAYRGGISRDMDVSFDNQKVEDIIDSINKKIFTSVKEADLLITDDKVVIRSGHHGESIDKDKAFEDVEKSIIRMDTGTLEIPVVETPPSRINVEDYYNRINQEVKDAGTKIEGSHLTIVPHAVGRSIEKSALADIASELEESEDTEKVLPVTFTAPKVTTALLQEKLFKDTLGSMSTQFYTGNQNDSNRGSNIRIAVSKINGTILAPGQVFSFNEVVGPRTEAGGYKIAHTYVGGKVIDGIGGGICQVSTTLYNSVLFSDLEVLERTNHMFTVGYVPLGRDAAVYYDAVDLKFKNSTAWPIKVEGWVSSSNRIYFAIKGTNETPGRTVEISPRTMGSMNFETKYIDDPTLPAGQESIVTEGMTGFIIDTYKIVRENGKVVSEGKIHTSRYQPLNREVKRGTKAVSAPPVQPVQPVQPPQPGVDEAANPPAKPVQ